MATNKHAVIRYQALDKCFSNFGCKFYIDDLIEACSRAIYDFTGIENGVRRRQIFDDIKFMESEEGYSIPLARHKDGLKTYYRYEDKHFSINQQPLSPAEEEQLRNTMIMLSRFRGLPQFDWIYEVQARFEDKIQRRDGNNSVVYFEQNPYLRGLEHFSGLFSAAVARQPIKLAYHPAFGEAKSYVVHPYALKQHVSRWYLLCLSIREGEENQILTLAIDRIDSFEPLHIPFIPNTEIDFEDYFDDAIGVTVGEERKPENITLKVDRMRYNFIVTKPLHHSQKVINSSDTHITIELKVVYNYELETTLLEFADTVEVIAPQHLRERIKERAKKICALHR